MNPTGVEELNARALIDGGDWACAHCNCGGLAEVAHRLAQCTCGCERDDLEAIERLAQIDMLEASTIWSRVSAALRAHGANAAVPGAELAQTNP